MPHVRLLKVIAGLVLAGAGLGALAGVLVALLVLRAVAWRIGSWPDLGGWDLYAFAGVVGALCGAVLAPIAGLTFWRQVPLWRLFAALTSGTVVGGFAGSLLFRDLYEMLGTAAVGALLAAAVVGRHGRRAARSAESHSSAG